MLLTRRKSVESQRQLMVHPPPQTFPCTSLTTERLYLFGVPMMLFAVLERPSQIPPSLDQATCTALKMGDGLNVPWSLYRR
ncbi:hypothetical protein V1264_017399 [Littorina saxatilis]|uniref:Uncharacterized protein n=1 Tax=Littorina saxatilis TaxID=31220 RepID=A0AAN9BIH2_9CAEN